MKRLLFYQRTFYEDDRLCKKRIENNCDDDYTRKCLCVCVFFPLTLINRSLWISVSWEKVLFLFLELACQMGFFELSLL